MANDWINIPTDDIYIQLPLSLSDKDVRIMFRNREAIDEMITKLQGLRAAIDDENM